MGKLTVHRGHRHLRDSRGAYRRRSWCKGCRVGPPTKGLVSLTTIIYYTCYGRERGQTYITTGSILRAACDNAIFHAGRQASIRGILVEACGEKEVIVRDFWEDEGAFLSMGVSRVEGDLVRIRLGILVQEILHFDLIQTAHIGPEGEVGLVIYHGEVGIDGVKLAVLVALDPSFAVILPCSFFHVGRRRHPNNRVGRLKGGHGVVQIIQAIVEMHVWGLDQKSQWLATGS